MCQTIIQVISLLQDSGRFLTRILLPGMNIIIILLIIQHYCIGVLNNFEAHSIWTDWILYKDKTVDFSIGGKVGLIPKNDFVLTEFYAAFNYQIINSLLIQTKYSTGSSFRSNVGYRSNSIIASLIWNL